MKLNLKMIAIAAAIASLAGTAQAALTSGSVVNNGSVALVAFNKTNDNWYIRNLDYLISSFLPSSITPVSGDVGAGVAGDKTPSTGLTISTLGGSGAVAKATFSDTAFATWYGQQNGAAVEWLIGGYDQLLSSGNGQRRMIITSSSASEGFTDANLDQFVTTGRFGGLGGSGVFSENTLSKTGTSTIGEGTNDDFLSGVSLASVGSSQYLYYVARSTGGVNTATAFENATGKATFTLATNGDLVYTIAGEAASAVPVPAAAWLLGSGLMAMGAAARRRRAAAKA